MVFQTALRSLSNRSIVVVCNYCMARYRRNHTEKKHVLYALVDPVSPPPKPAARGVRALVEAPGAAPGSEWFIAAAIYFHSRRTGIPNIGSNGRRRKGAGVRMPPAPGQSGASPAPAPPDCTGFHRSGPLADAAQAGFKPGLTNPGRDVLQGECQSTTVVAGVARRHDRSGHAGSVDERGIGPAAR